MDIVFFVIIAVLCILAVFDLSVGVSNDAVNFLNSAVGSKAAPFRRVVAVAAAGVFLGAVMSNGMMDIARHGIFQPEHFSFYEIICIFMAVMVTDIILIDVFNSFGMPTSTTVSMVFELLGATFAASLVKMSGDASGLAFSDLLNADKALSVIIGIFLSVPLAFVSGMLVQWLARLLFKFSYKDHLSWKIGVFGGLASTAIVYFLLVKGAGELVFMTPPVKNWIASNTGLIICCCLIGFTILMQVLHWLKVNVFKVIVLMGTFALAMAFAGNDLVNFIGVPLSGLSAYTDYIHNGNGDPRGFMMSSLNSSADTPAVFLLLAGVVMVVSLATSRKARNVVNTSVNLTRQDACDELFASSRFARIITRWCINVCSWIRQYIPDRIYRWINRRFDTSEALLADGAAFDLVRGSVNLVLAGVLIAIGTSLKLPLSTTYVTFMVAMGTSLADRAWGRESAVFRITGVVSVIGGWFVTAGVAFIGAGIIVLPMLFGGGVSVLIVAALAVVMLVRNNFRNRGKHTDEGDDVLYRTILATDDKNELWNLLRIYLAGRYAGFLRFAGCTFPDVTAGFIGDDAGRLRSISRSIMKRKGLLKDERRKETLCMRKLAVGIAIEKNAWFYLANNCCMAMLYNLQRINEVCYEHVDNNFRSLPARFAGEFAPLGRRVTDILEEAAVLVENGSAGQVGMLRHECENVKNDISLLSKSVLEYLHSCNAEHMTVTYVYLNMLNETQEMVSNLRKLLRASQKLNYSIRQESADL
ncbi:MAG: anion permease [Candidatus Aphodosoma sp.]